MSINFKNLEWWKQEKEFLILQHVGECTMTWMKSFEWTISLIKLNYSKLTSWITRENILKKSHTCEEGGAGTPQNFFSAFIDELEKQMIIKRTVEVGQ